MAIYIKAIVLAFVLIFLAESSSAPVDDQTSNTQVDLLDVDDLPQADSQSVDITRAKRHGYGGYGGYGKAQMSLHRVSSWGHKRFPRKSRIFLSLRHLIWNTLF